MAAVLEFRLTGGASNTDPNASLGGAMSSSAMPTNLFDDVSADEASAGDTEYRAIDVYNSGDATATSVVIYMDPETSSPDTQIDLGYDTVNSPRDPANDATSPPPSIPDESTAPTDGTNPITFGHYVAGAGLTLPDIPAGQAVRVWLKRTVAAGATNTASDTGTLKVEYA